MRPFHLLITCSLLLAACGEDEPGPLPEGRWLIDRPAMQQMFETGNGYTREHAAREARALEMTLDLEPDHTFRMRLQRAGESAESAAGTWRVEGDEVFLATTHTNGRKQEQISEAALRVTGDQMRYIPSDAYQLILTRKPD